MNVNLKSIGLIILMLVSATSLFTRPSSIEGWGIGLVIISIIVFCYKLALKIGKIEMVTVQEEGKDYKEGPLKVAFICLIITLFVVTLFAVSIFLPKYFPTFFR